MRCAGNGSLNNVGGSGRKRKRKATRGCQQKGQEPGLNGTEWKNCPEILILAGFHSETQK